MSVQIAALNQATAVSDAYVKQILPALQLQVNRDFAPIWGINAQITFYANTSLVPATSYQLVFLDDADQAGALGYHDLTSTGMPLGKVFIKTSVVDKEAWSVVASHELLEMLIDPYIDNTVFAQTTNTGGRLFAYEVCDAVEGFHYNINGVLVSDFVTPAWFEMYSPYSSTRFSFLNKVTAPFELATGGYIGIFDIPNVAGWNQLFFGDTVTDVSQKSRAMRRSIPYPDRMRSYK
jgi:hypothetical protein